MFETPKLELKNTAKVSCVFNYHKFYNQFPSPKNALKTPGILPSLCSASPWRAAKRPCLTKLGMDISPGWNSTVQLNNGVLHVFFPLNPWKILGLKLLGKLGDGSKSDHLKYICIYIYFAAGARYYHSHINSWVKSTPQRKCCWKMTRISGAVLKSDQPSCLDYGPASHKPIGRRTSPADLSSGGPPTKKQHVRSKILPLSCRCVHKIHALHTSLSVKHQIFCFRYEDFLATTPYLYVCGYPLVN